MKKVLLSTIATLFMGVAVVQASAVIYGAPQTSDGQVAQTADYGGVGFSTVTYSSSNVLLFGRGGGSISFIHFATAPAAGTNFAIIRATNPTNDDYLTPGAISGNRGPNPLTADFSTGDEVYRIHIASSLANNYNGLSSFDPARGYDYKFPVPLRINGAATFKLESVNYGPVTIGVNWFGDKRYE